MLDSQLPPSEFFDHLSSFLNEKSEEEDAPDIQDLLQDLLKAAPENGKIDTRLEDINKNKGKIQRAFEKMEFHILTSDKVKAQDAYHSRIMNTLINAYKEIYNKKEDARRIPAEMFMYDILEKYVFWDLIDPETMLLKDDLFKLLANDNNRDFNTENDEYKKQITVYFINAYLFYFLSGIFMEFSKRETLTKDSVAVNFDGIQNKLITCENLQGMINIKKYLKEDAASHFTEFAFAHKLILDLADNLGSEKKRHQFFSASTDRILMNELLLRHPDVIKKLQQCEGGYLLLGKKYHDAFIKLVPESPKDESKLQPKQKT